MNPTQRIGLKSLALACVLVLAACGTTPEPNRTVVRTDDRTALMKAAKQGNVGEVKNLMGSGGRINAMSPKGTPLYLAAASGHAEVVWNLLRQGADPDRGLPDGTTPLMSAASVGHKRVVDLLLDAGASVDARNDKGETALSYAALNSQLVVTKRLLGAGADVNVVNETGKSLLMRATARNDLLLSEVLVAADADVAYEGPNGRTALDIAQANGNKDLVMILRNAQK